MLFYFKIRGVLHMLITSEALLPTLIMTVQPLLLHWILITLDIIPTMIISVRLLQLVLQPVDMVSINAKCCYSKIYAYFRSIFKLIA